MVWMELWMVLLLGVVGVRRHLPDEADGLLDFGLLCDRFFDNERGVTRSPGHRINFTDQYSDRYS